MMAAEPEPSHSEGPLCKVCNRPMREHSFEQQKRCIDEAKKQGINLI